MRERRSRLRRSYDGSCSISSQFRDENTRQQQHTSLTTPSERCTRPFQTAVAVSDRAIFCGLELEPLQSTALSTSPIAGGVETGTALRVRPHGEHDLDVYFDICQMGTEVYNPKWTLPVSCVRTIMSSLCWRIALTGCMLEAALCVASEAGFVIVAFSVFVVRAARRQT